MGNCRVHLHVYFLYFDGELMKKESFIFIKLDKDLHAEFKAACALEEKSMQEVLRQFIALFVLPKEKSAD